MKVNFSSKNLGKYVKVSEYVAKRLAHFGLTDAFVVTGGGAMHLNDAFGESKEIDCHYMHHEQAAAIAAEGYCRIAGRPAILNVTTGPGALNSFNGVFGAYTDSIPMIVVAGQVRTDTISSITNLNIRQLGDQELRSMQMVPEITKFCCLIEDPELIAYELDKAYFQAVEGRPGPVWIEIPVNVQGMQTTADPYGEILYQREEIATIPDTEIKAILKRISLAKRPIIVSGTGVRIANVQDQVLEFAQLVDTPIVTAWNHDTISSNHRLFAGRPGTIGTRPGNFNVQASDLVVVMGSRLNIRQVSYNWESFAKDAEIIWIEIDPNEFAKPYLQRDSITPIHADLKRILPQLISLATEYEFNHASWINWCIQIREKYDLDEADYISSTEGINAYHLIPEIFRQIDSDTSIVCGNATATIVPFQVAEIRDGVRLFSNSGSASMGYDLPAALGAAIANRSRKVVCLAGDGSIMMNLQELQTLASWNLDVLIIVLDTDGYLSIKQTQQNFFGHDHGAAPKSGIAFPDFEKISKAFGIEALRLNPAGNWRDELTAFIKKEGPRLLVAPLEISQEFIPRLKSKMVNGVIQTPDLDDMFPHLDQNELETLRKSAKEI